MKPNKKQLVASHVVKIQASFWQSTNDINSPTHYSDIDQDCIQFEDKIGEENAKVLAEKLSDLYDFIKKLK